MENKSLVACRNCRQLLRVPNDRGLLLVTCPNCRSQFKWSPDSPPVADADVAEIVHEPKVDQKKQQPKYFKAACVIAGLASLLGLLIYFERANDIPSSPTQLSQQNQSWPRSARSPQWVNISYDELIDRATITHSGRTVGELLDDLNRNAGSRESVLSNLQPYFEPFSFICNEIITGTKPGNPLPYINILSNYPVSSRQPAWAALFREGNYQLYTSDSRARLFLKGDSPERLLDQYYSVIRHPLRTVFESTVIDRINLEIYAFENDYAAKAIRLDLNPYAVEVTPDKLTSRTKQLPLSGLKDFFSYSPIVEAAEIDDNQDFYLYGKPDGRSTVGGQPESLEDFAVVYRAVFHYGYNAPYISLDLHEDNRYAKVNFGGLLEDTRVGSVVLEADKLFKTLSTGLDPNTRLLVKEDIKKAVPDFLTEDERGLLEPPEKGIIHIRYWFYPDGIRTVTDNRIGAVQNCQFLADAERMDQRVPLGQAQLETIKHLNAHFESYARVLLTFQELQTVGRMMAIANWLHQAEAQKKVDLDALLSVELSPVTTPRRTQKMLAVTASTSAGSGLGAEERRKVYCLDKLVENSGAFTNDDSYLRMAEQSIDKMDKTNLIPAGIRYSRTELDAQEAALGQMESRIKTIRPLLDNEERTLDQYNDYEVDRFNAKARELNSLTDVYKRAVESYNRSVRNIPRIRTRTIASIGGGINLRPADFAKAINAPDSPILQRIHNARLAIERGTLDQANGIIRSATRRAEPLSVTSQPLSAWKIDPTAAAKGDLMTKRWLIGGKGEAWIESNSKSGNARYRTSMQGYFCETSVNRGEKEIIVTTSAYPTAIIAVGNGLAGKTIILKRSRPVGNLKTGQSTARPN